MPRLLLLIVCCSAALPTTASAGLVISQYYEGTSNNKWIELFNSGATTVDLSNYAIGTWSNANAEGYKSGAAPSNSVTLPSFSLPSGGVYLMSHGFAGVPLEITADYLNSNVINFNGNDSFAIYAAGAYSTSKLVDAIGFTESGNEGVDKSFVRLTLDPGYSLVAGSNATTFPAVWGSMTYVQANNALPGADAYLGVTSLTALAPVPEPTAALFGGLIASALGLTVARRPAQRD